MEKERNIKGGFLSDGTITDPNHPIYPNWKKQPSKMKTTTEQPATPVCPMTWAEIQKKGFSIIEGYANEPEVGGVTVFIEGFGEHFTTQAENLDQAAELLWSEFCDFINGRSNL